MGKDCGSLEAVFASLISLIFDELIVQASSHLEELDLLMLAQDELGRFAPVWSVFPAVFDQARWMSVNLQGRIRIDTAWPKWGWGN